MQRAGRLATAVIVAAAIHLVWRDSQAAVFLAVRLVPILVFVTAMSVVVNLAANAGVFTSVTRRLTGNATALGPTGRRWWVWTVSMSLAVVSTVFLSLDTTVLLITPLAIALGRRTGVNTTALALGVVWVANLGSLLLPVSNLTNLLAVSGNVIASQSHYMALSWLPATIALLVALAASAIVLGKSSDSAPTLVGPATGTTSQLLRPSLVVLLLLLPLLASPVPFWLSSAVAAGVLVALFLRSPHERPSVQPALVPWSSLGMITALSTVAASIHSAGIDIWVREAFQSSGSGSSLTELVSLSIAGGLLSNIINNIPAYLALEPAAGTAASLMSLLTGVNAGPVITPWASLATLLWADQLRRAKIPVPWRTFFFAGLMVAPLAVAGPVAAISFLSCKE